MELPLSSTDSASGSSSSLAAPSSVSTVNALTLKESSWDDPIISASSHSSTAGSISTSQHHQIMVDQYSCSGNMIPVYEASCHEPKKRKVDQQVDKKGGDLWFNAMFSHLQRKVSHGLYCSDRSTLKGENQKLEEEEEEEEAHEQEHTAGCTTPPHWQSSACNAADDTRRGLQNTEELVQPVSNNASKGRKLSEYCEHRSTRTDTSVPVMSYSKSECSCSSNTIASFMRRGRMPPPPPRKPKATPRIRRPSSHLTFFVPADLELFFSSNSTASTHDSTIA